MKKHCICIYICLHEDKVKKKKKKVKPRYYCFLTLYCTFRKNNKKKTIVFPSTQCISPNLPLLWSTLQGYRAEHWDDFSAKNLLLNKVILSGDFWKGRWKGMADGKGDTARLQGGEESRVIQVWRLIHHLHPTYCKEKMER